MNLRKQKKRSLKASLKAVASYAAVIRQQFMVVMDEIEGLAVRQALNEEQTSKNVQTTNELFDKQAQMMAALEKRVLQLEQKKSVFGGFRKERR